MTAVEAVTGPVAGHGEGPIWCPADQRVRFVDMMVGDVLSFDPATSQVQRRHVADVVAAIRPRRGGGFVVATGDGFALLDEAGGPPIVLDPVLSMGGDGAAPAMRMNEGGCDALGRFYAGTLAVGAHHGRGALYRLSPDHTVRVVRTGITISNGLAWTADGATAYYVDSATRRVDTFTVNGAGELVERRPFVAIPAEWGTPDGLCLDAEGGVWVALWDGGTVHRYDRDGELSAVIHVPVTRPTACAFGGPELTDLYITTSNPGGESGVAGALLRARPGVAGFADHQFAG